MNLGKVPSNHSSQKARTGTGNSSAIAQDTRFSDNFSYYRRLQYNGIRKATRPSSCSMKNFFRRRSLAYKGRGGKPTRIFDPSHPWLRLVLWTYFILCFLIIGARWFFTTQADYFRDDITAAVSHATGVSVRAEQFEADFDRFWPVLKLKGLTLSRPGKEVALTLPAVTARFSWSSLWHLEPRFRSLVIERPSLTIRRLDADTFDVAGFVLQTGDASYTTESDNAAIGWLLNQGRVEMIDGTFTYIDEHKIETDPVTIRAANAIFEQRLFEWRTAVEGTAHVNAQSRGEHFRAVAQIDRKLFTDTANPNTWHGRLYADLEETDIARLIRRLGFVHMASGSGAADVWLEFADGQVTRATADVALRQFDMRLSEELEPLRLNALTSRFQYEAAHDDINTRVFRLEGLRFQAPGQHLTAPANASLTLQSDAADHWVGGSLTATRLNLGSALSFLPQLPVPEDVRRFVAERQPAGQLKDIRIDLVGSPKDPSNWRPQASFDDLTVKCGQDMLPCFRNLSGRIQPQTNGNGIALTLDSRRATLSFPGVFRRPDMSFDRLQADATVSFHPTLAIHFSQFSAENAEAAINGQGGWTATGGVGTIDLSGNISRAQAVAVPQYIPLVVGNGLLDWLESGILDGSGKNGRFVVRGPLAAFPWDGANKGKGEFVIEADVEGGRLDFLPSHQKTADGQWVTAAEWPVLTDINAHLRFAGNGMFITGQSARSLGLRASEVEVEIPSFSKPVLTVKGRADGDLSQALRYLNEGVMLRRLLSSAFSESHGRGPTSVDLDLSIPLSGDIVKGLKVNVDAAFNKAEFYYGLRLPVVKDVTGRLNITASNVTAATPLQGITPSGHPVTVSAQTRDGVLRLGIDTRVTTEEFRRFLDLKAAEPFFKHLSGNAGVHVDADIGLTHPLIAVSGHTDLANVISTLPEPFVKGANQFWPTDFRVDFDKQRNLTVNVKSDQRADLSLTFASKQGALSLDKGVIALGTAQAKDNPTGVTVAVQTPFLHTDHWMPLILQDDLSTDSGASATSSHAVNRINLITADIDSVQWEDKTLSNMSLTARRFDRQDWHLRLSGDDAAGQIEYRRGRDKAFDSLKVNLTRLHLPTSSADRLTPNFADNTREDIPDRLPDVSLVVDDLRTGNRHIGKIELQAANRRDGALESWDIRQLIVRSPGATLQGNGRWLHIPGQHGQTELSLSARITDSGRLLESLAIPDAIHQAPATLNTQLSWNNAPHLLDLKTLNGTFTSEMGAGRFLQVEPGAGRLLSLLSMQHLLRRLTLDFKDVLYKGFSFDSANVTGTIQDGTVHLPKATVFGSAATVVLGGTVDLNHERLDLKTVILPAINAGGPSLALALVNPAVGIGTFLTQWIFKDQLSQMFRMEYAIEGSFDNPDVRKLRSQDLQAPLDRIE